MRLFALVYSWEFEKCLQGHVKQNTTKHGYQSSCAGGLQPAGLVATAVKGRTACHIRGIDRDGLAVERNDVVRSIRLKPVQVLAELCVCPPCYNGDVNSNYDEA